MIQELKKLSTQELELVLKAPLLISILIAGADGKIDKSEIRQSIDIAKSKQLRANQTLIHYYMDVAQDFEDKLMVILSAYPLNANDRNILIINELNKLNEIFLKIDKSFASDLYLSYREIAQKVAESSGGLLGFNSVGTEEAKLIDLPMIRKP